MLSQQPGRESSSISEFPNSNVPKRSEDIIENDTFKPKAIFSQYSDISLQLSGPCIFRSQYRMSTRYSSKRPIKGCNCPTDRQQPSASLLTTHISRIQENKAGTPRCLKACLLPLDPSPFTLVRISELQTASDLLARDSLV